MYAATLLADPACLRLERIVSFAHSLTLVVRTISPSAACPNCGATSERLHSRYLRKVADLPWHGVAVRLELHARKFFCLSIDCPRRVFTERLPQVVAPHARRTQRLNEALTLLAFALGGEAGARVAAGLGMVAGADTLLARMRSAVLPASSTPSVLGVDDWAQRKGQRYGTILVDLERRRPIELLPDRDSSTLAAWLRAHPGVEVISRDRGGSYAEGAREGAPTALQVADRWHLLKNLSETLERLLTRKHHLVTQAAKCVAVKPTPPIMPAAQEQSPPATPVLTRAERERAERRGRHRARYTEAVEMRQRGAKLREIAERVGVSTRTLRRWALRGSYPERADHQRRSILDPFRPYLVQRWSQGCHNTLGLWRELREQGFRGSKEIVRYHLSGWRTQLAAEARYRRGTDAAQPQPLTPPSPRRAAWMLLKVEAKEGKAEHRAFIKGLCELCPEVEIAGRLGREFSRMVRAKCAEALAGWLGEAAGSGVAEFESFSAGLRRDVEAVMGALTSEWSNGQVEGQINRLKMIKRQMYGRAKFDLLRARVLHSAQA